MRVEMWIAGVGGAPFEFRFVVVGGAVDGRVGGGEGIAGEGTADA